jgi:hypothetical protein
MRAALVALTTQPTVAAHNTGATAVSDSHLEAQNTKHTQLRTHTGQLGEPLRSIAQAASHLHQRRTSLRLLLFLQLGSRVPPVVLNRHHRRRKAWHVHLCCAGYKPWYKRPLPFEVLAALQLLGRWRAVWQAVLVLRLACPV